VAETIDLLVPAMRGVAAAHEQDVIHRDLKPDNIFLCVGPDGSPREAKVLDFGVSTITSPAEGGESTLTQDGVVLGTPAYMSAEQLENPRTVDVRADVHALGVILYEALTGRLPFEASTHNALVLSIAKNEPVAPRDHRDDLPEALEAVLLRAIGPERFSSVHELIDALEPFGSAPSRDSSVLPSAPSDSAPRRRNRALTLGLVALAAGAAMWFATRGASEPSDPGSAATRPAEAPPAAVPLTQTMPESLELKPDEANAEKAADPTKARQLAAQPPTEANSTPSASAPEARLVPKVPSPPPRAAPGRAPLNAATQAPVATPAATAADKRRPGRSGTISADDL
jgi:serine/threonine-protein kinase